MVAGSAGQTVNLTTTSAEAAFWDTADTGTITTVTIPAGSSTASFKYEDTLAGTPTLTASASGLNAATQTETVTAPPNQFSQMVIFGDSLSDTGNTVHATPLGAFALSLLGYKTTDGRFTSGTDSKPKSTADGVWEEILAGILGATGALKDSAVIPSWYENGNNWAYGGAETGSGTNQYKMGIPDNVGKQVSDYLSSQVVSNSALYAIWSGGNDLLDKADHATLSTDCERLREPGRHVGL